MSTTITALTTASGIDGAADWLPIDRTSLAATQKINRQTFLGVSGTPADISTAQALTNKTIGNTNAITIKDGSFTLQNTSDTTKQVVFSLAGITTATTRTLTLPNATATLATLAGIETLTNKTLTSPVITGGSIDNSTITVDSIAGHTSSTIVSIAGLSISSGVLNTANSVTATSIADGAIQPKFLVTGTGSGWPWQTYAPSWTNVTVGNGTVVAKYIQTGKMVTVRVKFSLGNTSAVGTAPTFSLPVTAIAGYTAGGEPYGLAGFTDAAVAVYPGMAIAASTTTATLYALNASATYTTYTAATAAIPFGFGNGDELYAYLTYEAA